MDYNIIIPAVMGVIGALAATFFADRVKAKADYRRAENDAARAENEKIEIEARINTSIAEATDMVRTQLINEIKRIQMELDKTRSLTKKQNKIIASIRLEASEMETRYQRRITELEKIWEDCQKQNKRQQMQYRVLIAQMKEQIEELGGTPPAIGGDE